METMITGPMSNVLASIMSHYEIWKYCQSTSKVQA